MFQKNQSGFALPTSDSVVALNLHWLIAPQFRDSADLRRRRHSGTGSNPFDLGCLTQSAATPNYESSSAHHCGSNIPNGSRLMAPRLSVISTRLDSLSCLDLPIREKTASLNNLISNGF